MEKRIKKISFDAFAKLELFSKFAKKILIMVYDFDENGYLKPQRIYKTDLAAFYNVSGRQFRRELLNVLPVNTRKQMFSIVEVAKIFEKLGRITRSEVQNARNNLRI